MGRNPKVNLRDNARGTTVFSCLKIHDVDFGSTPALHAFPDNATASLLSRKPRLASSFDPSPIS